MSVVRPLGVLFACVVAMPLLAQPAATFRGTISDSYCARDGHAEAMRMSKDMGTTDASCTTACVRQGAKYVLLDREHGKVYSLSDPGEAMRFAGQAVKITGTAVKSTIRISSIEADSSNGGGSPQASRK